MNKENEEARKFEEPKIQIDIIEKEPEEDEKLPEIKENPKFLTSEEREELESTLESVSEQNSESEEPNEEEEDFHIEVEKLEEPEIPPDEDITARVLREERLADEKGYTTDIGLLICTTTGLAIMIYLLITLLGFILPTKPLVVPKGAAKPFFHGNHRTLIEDNFDGTIKLSGNDSLSVILLYSPYSIKSKWFREEFYKTARNMKKLHGPKTPYFGATNCFDSSSFCRKKYNLKHYPAILTQNSALMGSVYNGPLNSAYLSRWINRLQNAIFRIQTPDDLRHIAKNHDLIVILFYQIRNFPPIYPSATNFTKIAFHYLDGDPNSERTIFCMVTDPQLAAQLQLHNEHDVVLVSSDLKLLATHYKGWEMDKVFDDVVKFSKEATLQNVEFLNLGRKFHSTQLAEKIDKGSVLLYFTQNAEYGSSKYKMLLEVAKDYRDCPEKELLMVETETVGSVENLEKDCSISLKSCFCESNNTLSFMIIDSEVEHALATKLGADGDDMVIAINAKQEITRFIRNNVTRENINCLIRQHHNAADNEFVSESAKINTTPTTPSNNPNEDAIGEPSYVRFAENVADLLTSKKINVILFSGGVWHSSSSSAIAPFHLLANYFKESRSIIDFSMVDVSETNVPYNLNFEQLPKILVTSADSIGLSWTYPEDFMINHTNMAHFILSRPGKIFGRLRWLNSCQGVCRKESEWKMRSERLKLKRQENRHVANSQRQRIAIGYYDRMLRMIS